MLSAPFVSSITVLALAAMSLAFARRVARQQPALAEEAQEFAKLYTALRYRPAGRHEKVLQRRLRRISRGSLRERLRLS